MKNHWYRQVGKLLLDRILAGVALVILCPSLVVVAALVRWYLGSPVLFRQTRPGLNGKPFTLLKFRTMTDERDRSGNLLPDAKRLTRFGRFLRTTSFDELPELLNVLKGEMSLVGPRPLLTQYLVLYTKEQARRHEVMPGITGWAQINGRNAISWEKKFTLDVWYVDHQSFWLDVRILFVTAWRVVQRSSISHEGSETMPQFIGMSQTNESKDDSIIRL